MEMELEKYTEGIPDVIFRNYIGESDLSKLQSVRKQIAKFDKIDPLSTLESIPTAESLRQSLTDRNCDPEKDILVVESNGEVVGYARVSWWVEKDNTHLYLHDEYLSPEDRKNGIENSMLHWSEDRIREISLNHIDASSKFFGANATSLEAERINLLLENGYEKVFSVIDMGLDMNKKTEEPKLPEGFDLREVKPEHLRMIWEANNTVYSDRDFVKEASEDDFNEFAEDPNNDYSLWQVVWLDDEIAAFVISEIKESRVGEVVEVSTVNKFRRNGLAHALLAKNISVMKDRNLKAIRLHTNGQNISGAKSLYEKMGFGLVKEYLRFRKPIN